MPDCFIIPMSRTRAAWNIAQVIERQRNRHLRAGDDRTQGRWVWSPDAEAQLQNTLTTLEELGIVRFEPGPQETAEIQLRKIAKDIGINPGHVNRLVHELAGDGVSLTMTIKRQSDD